jgi:hypothetical protein
MGFAVLPEGHTDEFDDGFKRMGSGHFPPLPLFIFFSVLFLRQAYPDFSDAAHKFKHIDLFKVPDMPPHEGSFFR